MRLDHTAQVDCLESEEAEEQPNTTAFVTTDGVQLNFSLARLAELSPFFATVHCLRQSTHDPQPVDLELATAVGLRIVFALTDLEDVCRHSDISIEFKPQPKPNAKSTGMTLLQRQRPTSQLARRRLICGSPEQLPEPDPLGLFTKLPDEIVDILFKDGGRNLVEVMPSLTRTTSPRGSSIQLERRCYAGFKIP